MQSIKSVCYEDFGAVGDGVTDDFDAVYAAHEYANENFLSVKAAENKVYYLGNTCIDNERAKPPIRIKTDVAWGNAEFIIDDSEITVDMPSRVSNVFTVVSDRSPKEFTTAQDTENQAIAKMNRDGGLKRDTEKLDLGLGYPALLKISDADCRVYIRYGPNKNAGSPKSEIVCVDESGNIDPDTPLIFEYEKITSITAYGIDDAPITLKGGIFTTVANRAREDYKYYARNMLVSRSNVTVENMTYRIVGEGEHGDPYSAFLCIVNTANVTVLNSRFQAHKYYMCVGSGGGAPVGMGTYAISAASSNNILWKGCIQTNFFDDEGKEYRSGIWGIMGSNYCKNLAYEDSTLSCFDAHAGLYNARIVNSTVVHIETVGSGTLLIEGCHIYKYRVLGLRDDYGSFWDGKIIIKDVTLHNKDSAYLVYNVWYNHDFGYPTGLPHEIIVDGLKLTSRTDINIFPKKFIDISDSVILDEINGEKNLNKPYAPERILIRNNREGYNYVIPGGEFFKSTIITEE